MLKKKTDTKDMESRLMRALADYQNLEKRHQTDRQNLIKFANQNLLDKLLPLLDDLNRAQLHLQDKGLELVLNHFNQLMASEEVVEIKALGEEFNPETMDCTQVVEGPKNQVVNVITPGYLYQDRVLRPARVEVGSGITK